MLTSKQRRYLKGLAHSLSCVVTIGADGLTSEVVEELKRSIAHHELIKIKLPAGDKTNRKSMLAAASDSTGAAIITLIGRTGILYCPSKNPRITLPKKSTRACQPVNRPDSRDAGIS